MLRAVSFGARNAVFTFGDILVGLFYTVTAQYVDDFTQSELEALVDGPERGQRIRQEVEQIIRSGKVCPAAIEA